MNKDQQKRVDKVNREIDSQVGDLRIANRDIPSKNTEEGQVFDKELTEIAIRYNTPTMGMAYEIYEMKHAEGVTEKKKVSSKQRNLAKKVGSTGGDKTAPTERKYADIHGRSLDDLMEEALEKVT